MQTARDVSLAVAADRRGEEERQVASVRAAFDRRRCRPSGTFSSASCLATALAFIVVAALMAWLTPMLLGR